MRRLYPHLPIIEVAENIKPIAGLRPATLFVARLIGNFYPHLPIIEVAENIKPIAGLRPATLFVARLIGNCCKANKIRGDALHCL
jgi:hypothetical protein